MILENTIKQASQLLKSHHIISHELDAEIILSDIMGVTKEFLIVNNHINISKNIIKKYNFAIKRRINREPVAYITGKKEFWSEDFVVNHATLVPRPETELISQSDLRTDHQPTEPHSSENLQRSEICQPKSKHIHSGGEAGDVSGCKSGRVLRE